MKALILLGLVFAILLFSGCTQLNSLVVKDCGADESCFIDSLKKCEPAKAKAQENFIGLGKTIIESEIKGIKEGNCEIHIRGIDAETNQVTGEKTCSIKEYQKGKSSLFECQ